MFSNSIIRYDIIAFLGFVWFKIQLIWNYVLICNLNFKKVSSFSYETNIHDVITFIK